MKKIAIFEPKEIYHQGIISILNKEGFALIKLNKVNNRCCDYDLLIIGFNEEQIENCFQLSLQNQSPFLALIDEECRPFLKRIVFKIKPLSYFHRSSPASIFLKAVNSTIKKQRFVDQKVAPWLLDVYRLGPEAKPLSSRELLVLNLVVNGNSNKEIAKNLYISLPTVKFHLKNIYQKTKTANRKELIALYSNLFIE